MSREWAERQDRALSIPLSLEHCTQVLLTSDRKDHRNHMPWLLKGSIQCGDKLLHRALLAGSYYWLLTYYYCTIIFHSALSLATSELSQWHVRGGRHECTFSLRPKKLMNKSLHSMNARGSAPVMGRVYWMGNIWWSAPQMTPKLACSNRKQGVKMTLVTKKSTKKHCWQ